MEEYQSFEELIKKVVRLARKSPALALCANSVITPEAIEDAAGNHTFDNYFEFWGITEDEGHRIRAYFQENSVRYNPQVRKYIEDLIDESF